MLQCIRIIYREYCRSILLKLQKSLAAGYRSRCSDCLPAGRSGDRIPVLGSFSAPLQTDPEAHLASCAIGIGSFPGGKLRPGRDADPSTPSSADVKNRVPLLSLRVFVACERVKPTYKNH
jgi:hypothetical protein